MTGDEEILDLVNGDDQVVDTISRADAYNPEIGRRGYYLRAASCFIMNSEGKLWIPKRQMHKKVKPGALDFSAGGHVSAGEDYIDGMLREFEEETGINAKVEDFIFIVKEKPADVPPHYYFQTIYLCQTDVTPQYNKDDFSGYEWLTIPELRQQIQDGVDTKDSLPFSLESLSAYIAEHGSDN